MTSKKVLLITGVSGYWGRRVAARVAAYRAFHVLGVDAKPPEEAIKGLDFITADIRNPFLTELLESEEVDTVCHLSFCESSQPSEAAFDLNVMGGMKVFGACAQAGVRKIVLKSSTCVYGAHPTNSAFLTEEQPLMGSRSWGTVRDLIELEAFCNGFRRQAPHTSLTILRFPNIVGPTADTPFTRFLKDPYAPMLLGFDPMMQVIHEDDVVGALVHAIVNDVPGTFNVAAEGVMPLTRIMSLAGKVPLPVFHLLAYWGAEVLGSVGGRLSRHMPIELDYIRYPWVSDLTKMRTELGFVPEYTAEEALREFAGHQRIRQYMSEPASLAYDGERLRDTIERRRRARTQRKITTVGEEVENHE